MQGAGHVLQEDLREDLAALDPDLTQEDLLHDPTLAMCCLEEVQQQRRAAVQRQALLAQDRSTQRHKLISAVLQPPSYAQSNSQQPQAACCPGHQQPQQQYDNADNGEEDMGEEAGELQDIRMRRLQQLQSEAAARQQRLQQGYGKLHTIQKEQELLRAVEAHQGCCVAHLAVTGYQACDECDQQLEGLAHQWQGTWFVRVATSRRSPLRTALDLQALPALVCFRGGALVGRSPLHMFGAAQGDIVEEQLVKYLKTLGVLRRPTSTVAGSSRPAGVASHGSDSADGEAGWSDASGDEAGGGLGEGGLEAPCELCGRRYPHEHVKAVYSADREDEEGDDEEDDL